MRHRATNVNIPECGCCGETVEGTVIRLRAEENGDKDRGNEGRRGSRDSSTPHALHKRRACCAQNDRDTEVARLSEAPGLFFATRCHAERRLADRLRPGRRSRSIPTCATVFYLRIPPSAQIDPVGIQRFDQCNLLASAPAF